MEYNKYIVGGFRIKIMLPVGIQLSSEVLTSSVWQKEPLDLFSGQKLCNPGRSCRICGNLQLHLPIPSRVSQGLFSPDTLPIHHNS